MNNILLFLILGDLCSAIVAFALGVLIRFDFATHGFDYFNEAISGAVAFALTLFVCSYFGELYTLERIYRKRELIFRTFAVALVAFLILSATYYLMPEMKIGRGVLLISLAAFMVLQFVWHACFTLVLKYLEMVPKVIVLGTGRLGKDIGDLIVAHNHDHVLAGYVSIGDKGNIVDEGLILGESDHLYEVAKRNHCSKIVIAIAERRGCLPVGELMKCKFGGIQVDDAVTFYEKLTGKLLVENINPGWFIFSEGFRITWVKSFMTYSKRLIDFLLALVVLTVVAPLLPLIYLAVKLGSPGPAIFKQVRVGRNEKNFTIYKFRTMCTNAEKETGAVWAQSNDPRVTRLGHFLRKTRLDELPQLFNVLKGDMSFSGPRPERPEFVEVLKQKIPYYSKRHAVKPGLTGWAQVKYPYGASEDDALEKLRYDLFYIKNYSFLLDFLIILETFKVVVAGRGAR